MQLLPTSAVAEKLGKTQRTVIRWCEAGRLKWQWGISSGKPGYLIEWDDSSTPAEPTTPGKTHHRAYYDAWLEDLQLRCAKTTVELYGPIVKRYLEKYPAISTRPIQIELSQQPSWASRQSFHNAISNYARFLQSQGLEIEPIPAYSLKPERPIRRTVITEEQLEKILQAIADCKFRSKAEKALTIGLISFMAYTGARVSEVASLTLDRADLEAREALLLRKGGQWHGIGLPAKLIPSLQNYIHHHRPASEYQNLFLNLAGKPLCRRSIGARIMRVSKLTGIDFTAHGLRRSFATINSQKGRPIEVISKSLNHKKLTTTQLYLRTTEKQVIAYMKDWD